MTPDFDPYHRWLGIPPKHQPADYYRLLALEQFEDDPEVIADAAERQIAHVRRYALGPHQDISQRILNELASAKACLLIPAKKAEYDRKLREQVAAQEQAVPQAFAQVAPPGMEPEPPPVAATQTPAEVAGGSQESANPAPVWSLPPPRSEPLHRVRRPRRLRSRLSPTLFLRLAAGGLLLGTLGIVVWSRFSGREEPEIVNSIGMRFKRIPPGEFLMGSPASDQEASDSEKPQHRVRITKPFYLGVYEVTQAEYQRVMGRNPSYYKHVAGQLPVEMVSWEDAREFCRKLSTLSAERQAGLVYRLPTEAEWEYACRAGRTSRYGIDEAKESLSDYAWYEANSENKTHPVGSRKPNAWGLYDMQGNIRERCQDYYAEDYYATSPSDDPPEPRPGWLRVDRGGSWIGEGRNCRSASRNGESPFNRDNTVGFRVVGFRLAGRFALPLPENLDLSEGITLEGLDEADRDAEEVRSFDADSPKLAKLADVKRAIAAPQTSRLSVVSRDPRVRVQMVEHEGGTVLTEAAVARGLRWLGQQQQPEGHWQLDGTAQNDSAATSLALLPHLGASQTHLSGAYKATVAKGLRWLLEHQGQNGDLRLYFSSANTGMYAQGLGAIVLSEAYLMTGDEELRQPAQKATDFIVAAQYRDGGWRYGLGRDMPEQQQVSDTSVVGWQLMALQTARAAKLNVPPETLQQASHYLDTAQSNGGSRYGYKAHGSPTHGMTAEALLSRIYLGWDLNNPALMDGIRWLAAEHPPSDEPDIYYWYHGTQLFHHVGGADWDLWNRQMRDLLVASQEKNGSKAGSWESVGKLTLHGGRLYMTSLAICTLEAYYRHLPALRQIEVK